MKKFTIACAALVVFASMVASASAADRAVSKATLTSMGLGSMQQLSDNDGLAIRGKGTSASVWGEGTARIGNQTSTNGYQASSSRHHGPSSAGGQNISYAAKLRFTVTDSSYTVSGKVGIAGGSSSAYAH